jgi:large subunit ribosomal protein L24
MKITKNDKVKILVGKNKGKDGVVERVYPKDNTVLILGMNLFKKHVRKSEKMPQGGIVEVPRPLPVSNVGLICPSCKKVTRVGYKVEAGTKKRSCKKCQAVI